MAGFLKNAPHLYADDLCLKPGTGQIISYLTLHSTMN